MSALLLDYLPLVVFIAVALGIGGEGFHRVAPVREQVRRLDRGHARRHLAEHAWFTGAQYGIADVAFFPRAFLPAFNEEDVIGHAIGALVDEGVEVAMDRFNGLPDESPIA